MAKALLGHVSGPNQRMAAELHRLRQRVCDLEARVGRLQKNAPREPVPGRMTPVTLGQFLPALPEGGRSSLTATMVRRMAMTIQLARFTVDDDAVPSRRPR